MQTMMAMMPPRLTRELSTHQWPKCCLQAVVLPSVLLEESATLCRLAEKEPPLLVMAACMQAAAVSSMRAPSHAAEPARWRELCYCCLAGLGSDKHAAA